MRLLFLFLLIVSINYGRAQNSYVDSLKIAYESEFSPEKKLKLATELSEALIEVNGNTAIFYAGEALKIATALGDDITIGDSYRLISSINSELGNSQLALKNISTALDYFISAEDHKLIAETYILKEYIYDQIGDYPNSLIVVQKALKHFEIIADTAGIAQCYNDIGVVHYYGAEYEASLSYTNKSYYLYKAISDSSGIGSCYNNLANTYWDLGEEELSLEFYLKGLAMDILIDDEVGQATSMCNLGEVYVALEDLEKAEKYFLDAYDITVKTDDIWTRTYALRGLSTLYSLQKNYAKALSAAKESERLSIELGAVAEESQSYLILSEVYKSSGDYNKSLEYFEKFHNLEDSIFNIENVTIINEMETKFQTNKISSENDLLKQEGELAALKSHEQEQKNFYLNIGLVLVLIVMLVVMWSLFIKQKANRKLKFQKTLIQERNRSLNNAFSEIEEKNKEITASISYAKRIQSAILPDEKLIQSHLDEFFILYKPKDIVAGDFYWFDEVDGTILFAAADCTGHGVPGAMVSVVCNNALNRAVREFGLLKPSDILDKVTDLVIEQFEKSDEDVKDGMDIALCTIKGSTLEYSGANNPLWIVRGGNLLETKPVKQPVGKFDKREPFVNHVIKLDDSDSVYLFSDGFIDQFGGPKGKKLKAKSFREILCNIQNESMEKQKLLLDDKFEAWRGDLEQIDDVCVIGVRI